MSDKTARDALYEAIEQVGKKVPGEKLGVEKESDVLRNLSEAWAALRSGVSGPPKARYRS